MTPPRGAIASGHIDVARPVAAGVTMEPAALGCGLAFSALEDHVAELWIDARRRSTPASTRSATSCVPRRLRRA
jgi:hypothetical protein